MLRIGRDAKHRLDFHVEQQLIQRRLFWYAMSAISIGSVKTTCGNRGATAVLSVSDRSSQLTFSAGVISMA
jgi:hypothetical protein